jgi:hypothetical protein
MQWVTLPGLGVRTLGGQILWLTGYGSLAGPLDGL